MNTQYRDVSFPKMLTRRDKALRALLCGQFAVILTIAAVPASGAEPLLTVVRGTGAGSDKAAAFVAHFVEAFFAADTRYKLATVQDTLDSKARVKAMRALKSAEQSFEKATLAYNSLDLNETVEHLNKAIGNYERVAGYITDTKKVADAMMLLAATHILRGEQKQGTEWLSRAVALDAEVEPDPRVFNPNMRQIFQQTVAGLEKSPRGSISVSSNPSYARVYLDGRFAGVAPTTLENLTEGPHLVRLIREGYRPWGGLTKVVGGREVTLNGSCKPTGDLDVFEARLRGAVEAVQSGGEEVEGDIAELGRMFKVKQVFIGAVELDGDKVKLTASQYDLKTRMRVRTASQVFSYDSRPNIYRTEVKDVLGTYFSAQAAPRDSGSGDDDGPKQFAASDTGQCAGMQCGTFKTVVLVGGGGLGVVIAGTGSILWILASQNYGAFQTKPQVSTEADDLRNSGEAYALLGDIFVPVGIAIAAVSMTTYFLWDPAPSVADVVSSVKVSYGITPTPGGVAASFGVAF